MGKWFVSYLNDAGYHSWFKHPDIYKMMIMDSFPPLDPLDSQEVSIESEAQMEGFLIKWLRVFDMHLKLANRGEGYEGFFTLPRSM